MKMLTRSGTSRILAGWMVFVIGLMLVLYVPRLFGLDYSDPRLGFTAKLPDGLEDVSKVVRVQSLISLGKFNESRTTLIKLILIQDLGGRIGREDLSKNVPPSTNATLEKTAWKSFQVDVFRIRETVGGVSVLTFNAQVPLKPNAIQITVTGPATEESALRKDMEMIVASVEGPTNWLTSEERLARFASGLGRFIAFVCLLVIVIIFVVGKIIRRKETR